MRINKRFVIPLLVVGVLAAGGAAYTDAVNFSQPAAATFSTLGYGKLTVTGATVSDIHYVVDPQGQNITEEDVTFNAELPLNETVYAAWQDDGGSTQMTACLVESDQISVRCDTPSEPVATATNFDITVLPHGSVPGDASGGAFPPGT